MGPGEGNRWVQNIIPATSELEFGVRTPRSEDLSELKKKVERCFLAGKEATGCELTVEWTMEYKDLRNNAALQEEYKSYMESHQDVPVNVIEPLGSTDFGDVSHVCPSIHPMFAIPVQGENSGNHTYGFAKAAATEEAHNETLKVSAGIAVTAARVLLDSSFAARVRNNFDTQVLGQVNE
ncbi:hypothetical protein BT69DRAFT_1306540 [Atractiella rhizophila]|nr:hypothetical protein BT69DRAFT_1306540 [Atractiella rhizophila]